MLSDCRIGARALANHQRSFVLLLSCWQSEAPVVPSRSGLVAFAARHARGARCGVRQPCCRSSRAHDPVRVMPLTMLVAGMPDVLVTIIESFKNGLTPGRRFLK